MERGTLSLEAWVRGAATLLGRHAFGRDFGQKIGGGSAGGRRQEPARGGGAGGPGAAGEGEGLVPAGNAAWAAWRVGRWRGTRLSTIHWKSQLGGGGDSQEGRGRREGVAGMPVVGEEERRPGELGGEIALVVLAALLP